ncbi:MAG: Nramp family divalent metal transporter [Ignavibacteriaceae bacterium]
MIKKIFQSFLPGIFLLGFNIGTGSVTAMAKAGADYGMSLLWTILLSCIITFLLIDIYGKYTIVTGETALEAFKKHIHPAIGIFFIVALGTNVCGSVMGVMGIISEVCYEWSKLFIKVGIQPVYFALFFVLLVYLLFLVGRTKFFEKALALIVGVMALCFIINFFILIPPMQDILKGLIPSVPSAHTGDSAFLVVASMVGTTVFSGLFILRTTLVKEAGWSMKDLRAQRNDALFSAVMMFIISASIMASAAGSFFLKGIRLDKVSEMINLLEPLAGSFAVFIFTIGLVAAGISSQFPNVLLVPWLLCDYNQSERDMKKPKYRIIVFLFSLLGLVVPVFHAKPIIVMIASQAFGALILPFTVACIIYLGNKKTIMESFRFSPITNIALSLIFIFSITMSYMGLTGLFTMIKNFS